LGATVLVATHTLSEAEAICDRVAIIRHGKVFAAGSVAELTSRMTLSTVFDLVVLGTPDRLREAVSTVPGVRDATLSVDRDRVHVSVQLGASDGVVNGVLEAIVAAGATVEACTTRRPTLDDIYRAAHAIA
jgi:ABC-2 type transport system ATP-binding protein